VYIDIRSGLEPDDVPFPVFTLHPSGYAFITEAFLPLDITHGRIGIVDLAMLTNVFDFFKLQQTHPLLSHEPTTSPHASPVRRSFDKPSMADSLVVQVKDLVNIMTTKTADMTFDMWDMLRAQTMPPKLENWQELIKHFNNESAQPIPIVNQTITWANWRTLCKTYFTMWSKNKWNEYVEFMLSKNMTTDKWNEISLFSLSMTELPFIPFNIRTKLLITMRLYVSSSTYINQYDEAVKRYEEVKNDKQPVSMVDFTFVWKEIIPFIVVTDPTIRRNTMGIQTRRNGTQLVLKTRNHGGAY
jgi:hypothetical protein